VLRDINDDINTVGVLDPDTRKLVVTVEWSGPNSIVLETYLTNFLSD
jgi:hypothetical protein